MATEKDKKTVDLAMVASVICTIAVFGLGALYLFGPGIPFKGYTGEYPQLFTVAVNSIPDAKGYYVSEVKHQPGISLIEEDSQGRQMFCYCEDDNNGTVMYLLICHSYDDENAYYYEGAYTCAPVSGNPRNRIKAGGTKFPSTLVSPMLDFTDEQVEMLKEVNDWDRELNLSKCTKAPIIGKVEK